MSSNLVFSGRIGSGKSSVSREVARALGFRWTGFGRALHEIARERGLETTRQSLQALGEHMVGTEPTELCRRVIAAADLGDSELFVIDGLRHLHIRAELAQLLSVDDLRLIYVDVPDAVRHERLKIRDGLTEEQIKAVEAHSTELQVSTELRECADYIADNSCELGATVAGIISWLRRRYS